MSCSNGTPASPQFLSFLPRWRQPQPRNRIREEGEEERRPRAQPQRLPHLTRRPLHTFPHHGLRRRSRHREPRHTSLHPAPRRISLHPALRRISLRPAPRRMSLRRALRRNGLCVPPVRPRPWPGMRHPREPLRLLRSNSRESAAAGVARELPNRASSPPGRAWQHRAAVTPLHNKTWLRNRVCFSRIRRAAPLGRLHDKTLLRNKV